MTYGFDSIIKVVGGVVGLGLLLLLCAWGVWTLGTELRSRLESGKAVDRTLSEVYKEDAPGMFWLQITGLVLLIGFCAFLGIGLVVGIVRYLVGSS
jgi:hypothetical protein